jgi:hypothetical protein
MRTEALPHTQDWKVPVTRTPICIDLAGGEGRKGHVFLQLATESRRPQSVLDLLNDSAHFLALEEDERLVLLHKGIIRWVEAEDDLLPPDEGISPERQPVRLEFASGLEMRGEALIAAPPGRRRVMDLLNGPEPFFALVVEGRVRVVHKRFIHLIEPIGS